MVCRRCLVVWVLYCIAIFEAIKWAAFLSGMILKNDHNELHPFYKPGYVAPSVATLVEGRSSINVF
jgi:hypothetical protein